MMLLECAGPFVKPPGKPVHRTIMRALGGNGCRIPSSYEVARQVFLSDDSFAMQFVAEFAVRDYGRMHAREYAIRMWAATVAAEISGGVSGFDRVPRGVRDDYLWGLTVPVEEKGVTVW